MLCSVLFTSETAPSHHIRSLHSQLVQAQLEVSQLDTRINELKQVAGERELTFDTLRRQHQEELDAKLREEAAACMIDQTIE
jgi:hypothetical protein